MKSNTKRRKPTPSESSREEECPYVSTDDEDVQCPYCNGKFSQDEI
jgi:uncharacterized Zn-finger protein